MVIFQAIVLGQSPLVGECCVFDGFEAYLREFPKLWNLLSPEGISDNRAYHELALSRNPRLPQKASTTIAEPTKYRYRSALQENLRSLASLLLEDVEDDPRNKISFYKECYVPIEANNRHLLLSKQVITNRYNRVGGEGDAPQPIDSSSILLNQGSTEGGRYGPQSTSKPYVVLGDVGVGKTSFFENLYQGLDEATKENTYFIHVNLGIKATLSDNLRLYILEEIPRVLLDSYNVDIYQSDFINSIYYQDLQRFNTGIYGQLREIDPAEYTRQRIRLLSEKMSQTDRHLQASLGHLARGRRKSIILIIDNTDQRTFELQQQAFLIAQEFA